MSGHGLEANRADLYLSSLARILSGSSRRDPSHPHKRQVRSTSFRARPGHTRSASKPNLDDQRCHAHVLISESGAAPSRLSFNFRTEREGHCPGTSRELPERTSIFRIWPGSDRAWPDVIQATFDRYESARLASGPSPDDRRSERNYNDQRCRNVVTSNSRASSTGTGGLSLRFRTSESAIVRAGPGSYLNGLLSFECGPGPIGLCPT